MYALLQLVNTLFNFLYNYEIFGVKEVHKEFYTHLDMKNTYTVYALIYKLCWSQKSDNLNEHMSIYIYIYRCI